MPTILVADDNSNIQKMVSLAFEEHGIDVVAVGNGEAAVRRIPDLNPDIVLADVFMPVRNGYEVCEFVKQDPRFSRVPVILLVGAFDPLDENEARRVGADGVLKKPFVPPDPLIAMVTSALEKTPRSAPVPQAAPLEEVLVAKPAPPPAPFVVPQSELEPEPDESVFAYGTGRRGLDEEAPEPPAAEREEMEEQEAQEGSESRWSETAHDWRRNAAMGIEVPENMVAESATTPMETAAPELEEERTEQQISDATTHTLGTMASVPPAPLISPPSSRSGPIEWLDMMAPPPAVEHPSPWTEPESEASQTPESAPFTPKGAASETSLAPEVVETLPPVTTMPPEPDAQILAVEEAPVAEPPASEDSFFEPSDAAPLPSPEPEPLPPGADSFFVADEDSRHMPPSLGEQAVQQEEQAVHERPVEETHPAAFAEEPAKPVPQFDAGAAAPPDLYTATPETPFLAAPASGDLASDVHTAPVSSDAPAEVQPHETVTPPSSSDVDVEAAVARVLEKLEPQLRDILSSGVLRPLVENLLQQELKKKQ